MDAGLSGIRVVRRLHEPGDAELQELAAVLVDCVDGGASVSFMQPLTIARALDFWRSVAASAARGERALIVAEDDTGIVSKMLVHRRARRHGVGEALMQAAEQAARAAGKTLLVLDTASADAERLYVRLGWQRCGVIPGYALLPGGGLCDTTYFYRTLPP